MEDDREPFGCGRQSILGFRYLKDPFQLYLHFQYHDVTHVLDTVNILIVNLSMFNSLCLFIFRTSANVQFFYNETFLIYCVFTF